MSVAGVEGYGAHALGYICRTMERIVNINQHYQSMHKEGTVGLRLPKLHQISGGSACSLSQTRDRDRDEEGRATYTITQLRDLVSTVQLDLGLETEFGRHILCVSVSLIYLNE